MNASLFMVPKTWGNLIMGTIKKVNYVHIKFSYFSLCCAILGQAFAATGLYPILAVD
jgi:hypothetical protein